MGKAKGVATAERWVPDELTLPALRSAALECRGCDLWERGTQTVFGAGTAGSEVMLVGEQPGDQEDRSGEPFVGPAGRLLDDALESAGIDRTKIYVTNAVKHFKWEERGKRRIHKKPNLEEVLGCKPWLEAEVSAVKPRVIVALRGSIPVGQGLSGDQAARRALRVPFGRVGHGDRPPLVDPARTRCRRAPDRDGGVHRGSETCLRRSAPPLKCNFSSTDKSDDSRPRPAVWPALPSVPILSEPTFAT